MLFRRKSIRVHDEFVSDPEEEQAFLLQQAKKRRRSQFLHIFYILFISFLLLFLVNNHELNARWIKLHFFDSRMNFKGFEELSIDELSFVFSSHCEMADQIEENQLRSVDSDDGGSIFARPKLTSMNLLFNFSSKKIFALEDKNSKVCFYIKNGVTFDAIGISFARV